MGVLKVYDGTGWKNIGCGGTTGTTGRLKLWDGTQWVREKCDSDTGGFTDDFNRADSTTVGNGWTELGGVWHIASNRAQVYSAGSSNYTLLTRGLGSSDADLSVKMADAGGTTDAGGRVGFAFRVADVNNYILVRPGDVYRLVGGAFTLLASFSSPGFGPTDVFRAALVGTTVTVYKNGVAYDSYSAVPAGAATSHGLYGVTSTNPGGMVFDDFAVGGPTSRPLKMWDGTTWQTVACMVPA